MKAWERALAIVLLSVALGACGLETAPPRALHAAAPLPAKSGTYRVLVPPLIPGTTYPVLYFLHDYFGDSGILWRQGVAAELLRRIEAGTMPPLILVAPDGEHGYWSDFHDRSHHYESWIAQGLREEIEARFPVREAREARAVSGISMGGFGAVKLALHRPELYSSASSLSGALLPLDWDFITAQGWFGRRRLTRIFGRSREANNTVANDPRRLVEALRGKLAPALLLRVGTEDKYHLDEAARRFADAARAAGLETTLTLEPGGHHWSYWRRSALEVVDWHARQFAAQGGQPK